MITVRQAQVNDEEQVLEMLQHVWDEDWDYVKYLWLDWVKEPEQGLTLVAEYEGTIVGTCYIRFLPDNLAWFQALRVHKDFRRLGVGSALSRQALAQTRVKGKRAALLGIDADNTPSLTLTAKNGFKKVVSYIKLSKSLNGTDTPSEPPNPASKIGAWVKATEGDAETVIRLTQQQAQESKVYPALYFCWTWTKLSESAAHELLPKENYYLLEDKVVANIEMGDGEVNVFNPVGKPADIVRAIRELLNYSNEKYKLIDIWIHPDDSPGVSSLLDELGFSDTGDGYVIWEHSLAK